MQKGPIPLRVKKEDPLLITTHRLIVAIGTQRFAMDMTTRCTELKPSRAGVLRIYGQSTKSTRQAGTGGDPTRGSIGALE